MGNFVFDETTRHHPGDSPTMCECRIGEYPHEPGTRTAVNEFVTATSEYFTETHRSVCEYLAAAT